MRARTFWSGAVTDTAPQVDEAGVFPQSVEEGLDLAG
jgi:hypothetical protein